jgi:hypothetical protein
MMRDTPFRELGAFRRVPWLRVPFGVAAVTAALAVLTVAVRLPPALHDALWLDETVSARIISAPTLGSALHRVRQTESSPPGWHVANRALRTAGGGSPSTKRLRVGSILLSVALTTLVVAYGLMLALRSGARASPESSSRSVRTSSRTAQSFVRTRC